jgi:hypothetical protein
MKAPQILDSEIPLRPGNSLAAACWTLTLGYEWRRAGLYRSTIDKAERVEMQRRDMVFMSSFTPA